MLNELQLIHLTNVVDKAIMTISGRDLVSTSEMTDLLLDIRLLLCVDDKETVSVGV